MDTVCVPLLPGGSSEQLAVIRAAQKAPHGLLNATLKAAICPQPQSPTLSSQQYSSVPALLSPQSVLLRTQ